MCITCDTKLSPESLDEFGNRYLEILNHGTLAVMISIGHRTGLFSTMSEMGPATSHEIAAKSNLNERYVREWLGAIACGGLAHCDETGSVFSLPPAAAALLTGSEGATNLSHLGRFVAMMGFIEKKVADCFRDGGGVPYSAYPDFHEIMATESKLTVVEPLFDHILPIMPGLTERLGKGIDVLDVGCGRGKALIAMATEFPNSHFTGWDLNGEILREAQFEAASLGLRNITFQGRDLSDFHLTAAEDQFDFVTAFDAIHDQARPDHVLTGIRRALKPGGLFLMQEIGASSNVAENASHPIGTLLYGLSLTHCMTVSLAQGGLGVGAVWGEKVTREFLMNAGFGNVERHILGHDIQNYYYVVNR